MNIRAVAFDMDGLMFNTEDLYDQVGQILLQRRGLRFTHELKMMMMGRPGTTAFEIMIAECNLDDSAATLQQESDQIFQDLLPAGIRTMPGLIELLDHLESLDLPKAVVTSSHRNFAQRALGFFDLEPRFRFVLTAEDVVNGKPHPEMYVTAAQKLNVSPYQLLALEDSLFGTQSAKAAGAITIAVPTEHSRGVDFGHVDHVADSLKDPNIFELLDH